MTSITDHSTIDWIDAVLALLGEALDVIARAQASDATLEARMTLAVGITALRTDLIRERAVLDGRRSA